jgi:hypothetical protein
MKTTKDQNIPIKTKYEKDAFSILNTLIKSYEEEIKKGADMPSIIDLSIGNPDLSPKILWINLILILIIL